MYHPGGIPRQSVPTQRIPVLLGSYCGVTRTSVRALLALCLAAPAAAATLTVPEGGSLQDAIDSAQPGDEILLAPGATYSGNFRLPLKPGADFITIRTDAPAGDLPATMRPAHSAACGVLPKKMSPRAGPLIAVPLSCATIR